MVFILVDSMNVLVDPNAISRPLAVKTCRVYELVESRIRLLKTVFRRKDLKDGVDVFLPQAQSVCFTYCVLSSTAAAHVSGASNLYGLVEAIAVGLQSVNMRYYAI
jgi:hypothetical protein